jgi:hypothetical protein
MDRIYLGRIDVKPLPRTPADGPASRGAAMTPCGASDPAASSLPEVNTVKLESVVARNDELPSAPVDREIVFLNLPKETYVALDEIGRRIWELLERPRPVGELIDALEREFTGPPEQIAADVIAFLDELQGDGMLNVVDD